MRYNTDNQLQRIYQDNPENNPYSDKQMMISPTLDSLLEKVVAETDENKNERDTYINIKIPYPPFETGNQLKQLRNQIESRISYRRGKIFMPKLGEQHPHKSRITFPKHVSSSVIEGIKTQKAPRKISEAISQSHSCETLSYINFLDEPIQSRFHDDETNQSDDFQEINKKFETEVLVLEDPQQKKQPTITSLKKGNLGNMTTIIVTFFWILVIFAFKIM